MGFLSQKGFGIEEAWLRKGLKQIVTNPVIFTAYNEEKSQLEIGMGNRQIKALKDWMIAAGLVVKSKGKNNLIITDFGKVISKYDAGFAEDATFWVIHQFFSQNTDKLLFYYWYVNEFELNIFKRDHLKDGLTKYISTTEGNIEGHCLAPLLQCMRKTRLGRAFGIMIEDSPNQFKRIEPPEDKLDPIIVAWITMDWAKRNGRSSANLMELATLKCSPGKILHISINRYSDYLDKIQALFNKEVLWISYTAGLNSVAFEKDINPFDILKAYYIKKRDGIDSLDAFHIAKKDTLSTNL